MDQAAVKLAVEIAFLSCTSNLLIGFNSLNAYASVNHMHLHFYYLMTSESLKQKNPLPIQNLKVKNQNIKYIFYRKINALKMYFSLFPNCYFDFV